VKATYLLTYVLTYLLIFPIYTSKSNFSYSYIIYFRFCGLFIVIFYGIFAVLYVIYEQWLTLDAWDVC